MRRVLSALGLAAALAAGGTETQAFCGFYVAKADTKLFNKASKVVVARKGERTVVTMASDYRGELKEFALVIPVPTVVAKEQIKVVESAWVDHLDAYSAPRLVEYFDPDPCAVRRYDQVVAAAPRAAAPVPEARILRKADALGVKIEAEYTVGEYDIVILSATQSDGLATYLDQEGYRIPAGAAPVLGSYIKQNMKFFLAKVNLKEQAKSGGQYLRPIQVAYDTAKFMLPIRLGTVNASGPQDMIMLFLTEKGRVETTNYRTVRLPSNMDVPIYTKAEFGRFYTAMFDHQVKKDGMKVVYTEYAWDMGWCDPCAADPLPDDKLVALGATWVAARAAGQPTPPGGPQPRITRPPVLGTNVFVTRLHVRYDALSFPEDLMFQETADRGNFQGRYVLRHPFKGEASCPAGEEYRRGLALRYEKEAATLAHLTGWDIDEIRRRMRQTGQAAR
jgi:hypothetical protein